jgi:hypothetical protein
LQTIRAKHFLVFGYFSPRLTEQLKKGNRKMGSYFTEKDLPNMRRLFYSFHKYEKLVA